MKPDIFYTNAFGRFLLKAMQRLGVFRLSAFFLKTKVSRHLIPGYIKRNNVDMEPFADQEYDSFASFFSRKKGDQDFIPAPDVFISPCDGLLSIYPITDDSTIPIKGSLYTITDLIPDIEITDIFKNGLCLVFRLEASDYHHFCFIDDGLLSESHYIPGELHTVQPIAHRYVPVYRLNRRWWSVMDTTHFGIAAQIEIGAMLVGGVSFCKNDGWFSRGEDMGCFELAGSTIVLLLNPHLRERLVFSEPCMQAMNGEKEVRVKIGSAVGKLKNDI